ncbi:thioredoxin domain-containing protein [[Leptolyngbya] sp. PCC 7376]|uniref:DsbA family protein n=1 Tax=[Leptolyngbya] sp. PCC 7376 TaxID=111781 RepID=UPI001CEC5DE4|nr:thioredoxin domain-containing protein [[Leptolyngbya] sp. PCC 7376]
MLAFFAVLLLSTGLWSCTPEDDAQADSPADKELEEQVLEIIRNNPEAILEAVQKYQQEQQQAQQEQQQAIAQEFQQTMTTNPKEVVGDAPVMGSEDFKVVLIEFSDFECPFCANAHSSIKTFMEKNGDTVTLAYKHLPLQQIHPQAIPAAQASWAAHQQDKFWEYHDRLFESQNQLGDRLYEEIAQELDLNLEKFQADIIAAEPTIQKDLELAQQLQLNGTPFFILASTETGKMETFSGALTPEEYEAKLSLVNTPDAKSETE